MSSACRKMGFEVTDKFNRFKKYITLPLEWVYFVMLILLTSYYMLSMTCVKIPWNTLEENIPILHFMVKCFILEPQNVLAVIAVLRYCFSEEYDIRVLLAASIIGKCAIYVFEQTGYTEMLVMILLMLGARGISFRRLVKVHFTVCLTIFVSVVFASQVGWIENLIYDVSGRNLRASFGFSYPTRFAAHVFYLLLWYWYLRAEKFTYVESILPLLGSIFVYYFSDARQSSVLLALLCVIMLFQTFRFKNSFCKKQSYQMNTVFSLILSGTMTWCAIIVTFLSMFYTPQNEFMAKLDSLLSARLYLGKKGMDIFGFSIWGRWIRLRGNGESLSGSSTYFYIDSSFLQFSLQYGLIMTVIILLLFWRVGVLVRKYGEWILLWVLVFAALHGLAEPHVLRLGYSPLIFAAFANIDSKQLAPQLERRKSKK